MTAAGVAFDAAPSPAPENYASLDSRVLAPGAGALDPPARRDIDASVRSRANLTWRGAGL